MFHLLWILYFPIKYLSLLLNKYEDLNQPEVQEKLEFLLEENKFNTKLRALFQILFMLRRLVSVFVLVFLFEWPFFQCTLLMVLSTINLAYLISSMPMRSKFENYLNLANEACIAIFSHLMTTLLNVSIPKNLFNALGNALVTVVVVNVLINLSSIAVQSIQGSVQEFRRNQIRSKIEKAMAKREIGRQKLETEHGMKFEHY